MLPRETFIDRRDNHCSPCKQWDGVCSLGHILSSPQGCPEKKFPPVQGATYATPIVLENKTGEGCGSCGGNPDPELDPVSWTDIMVKFSKSMLKWANEGLPIVGFAEHQDRNLKCKSNECGSYKKFQCQECQCIVYLKTKLKTESCPKGKW